MSRLTFALTCIAACALLASPVARADDYPSHPIRIVVPYAPGGAVDLVGRMLAERLGKGLGQTVVVENRPGAGGMIGVQAVAAAPADGYTLLVVDPSVVINPSLQANPGFALKDLTAISTLTASPLVLSTTNALPVTDMASLVRYAQKAPGGLTFASAGVGTTPHMAGELLALRTGLPLVHVPYKGSGPAMADLMAGHVQMAFSTIAAAGTAAKDGKIRPIATSGTKPPPTFPDLPTVQASGVKDFGVLFWTGLFVPAHTPAAIERRLSAELKSALADPATIAALEKSGEVPSWSSIDDSGTFVKAEFDKWAQVIKTARIAP